MNGNSRDLGRHAPGRCPAWLRALCALVIAFAVTPIARAQFQMPDAKQMSGIPRPVTDLPNGSISIRLIRGDLSNNIPNHPVDLHVGSKVVTVKTDENGRAQFDRIEEGATVKAVAVVDGEELESQPFPMPGQGVRMMLVATDKNKAPATTPDAPPISGQVAIGDQSRIVIEPGDENVQMFYLLDIENTARAPVNPPVPFAFDLPDGAKSSSLMEGSSPQAVVKGRHVSVAGPFAPGHTFVQVGYALPGEGGSIEATQTFPAAVQQLAVVVKKVGATTFKSSRVQNQRELPAEGETYIAATGGTVQAGQAIDFAVSGFPHRSSAPRLIALGLAVAIIAGTVWAARKPDDDQSAAAAERKRLIARREKLFADLVRLENDRRSGRVDERRSAARREDLVAALEEIYGALDDDSVAA